MGGQATLSGGVRLRQAAAEFTGTALLLIAVVGSGIAAERLSPDDTGLQLLESAPVTGRRWWRSSWRWDRYREPTSTRR